ncbi:Bromodomain-containing protein [Lactarius deliciosus]|nr:Bromodomain-containing protein [Lactarius deliciosus]
MDVEVEQVDGLQAASPVTEQSRRDRKHLASHLHAILIVPDKRKVSEAASIFSDSIRDRKKVREDSQPVDEDEPGPVRRRGRPPAADSQTSKKFQTVIIMVHSQISQHRNGNIFHNPIKKSEAPDYYDIVKRPMDLKTIKARIREGQIASSAEFQRDVYLMFANSLMYNRPGSDIYTMAEEMMLESEAQINTFRQTEGIIKGSHR